MTSQHHARKRARYQVPSTYSRTALANRSFPSHPESSIPVVLHFEDSPKAENRSRARKQGTGQSRCPVIRIDVLPDELLLAIFGHYVDGLQNSKKEIEAWQSLVHVCRTWRRIVFGSPNRLDLQLVCTPTTPARGTLDVWPTLPLLIQGTISLTSSVDDIAVAFGRSSRICSAELGGFLGWQLENILPAMRQPFPEMVYLLLRCEDETAPVIPDSFMGGCAPRLQYLELERIPFPGLPKLLLSATHLIELHLSTIPHSGYISPEAMLTSLSMLTSLETLSLQFQSPRSHPDWKGQPQTPTTRSVLPTLTYFRFKGVSEYLEDLVAHVDAPRLNGLDVTFFNQIDFDTPLLTQFISRTPTFKAPNEASVFFRDSAVSVTLISQTAVSQGPEIAISCRESDWQLSSLAQVCASSVPLLSTVEKLYIQSVPWPGPWKMGIENAQWLEFLRSFAAVKILHINGELTTITSTLQELGGRMTEVLPTLQNINISKMTSSTTVTKDIRFPSTGDSRSSNRRFVRTFPRNSSHTSI